MRNGPLRQALRVLLLALLLAGQAIGHAHAADHATLQGKASCAVCPIAQQAGSGLVDCGVEAATVDEWRPPLPACTPLAGLRPFIHRHARSPPART